jgi:hypothetical protein
LISLLPDIHFSTMRNRMVRSAAIAVACAIALCSCASLQRARDGEAVKSVTGLVNAGQAERLATMSTVPFIVDGEIVALAADVAGFWDGIVKAGFRIEDPVLDMGQEVGPDAYVRFADTMEARTFFERYVKKGSRIVELSTASGARILLLVRPDWFSWKVMGWKGPFTQ